MAINNLLFPSIRISSPLSNHRYCCCYKFGVCLSVAEVAILYAFLVEGQQQRLGQRQQQCGNSPHVALAEGLGTTQDSCFLFLTTWISCNSSELLHTQSMLRQWQSTVPLSIEIDWNLKLKIATWPYNVIHSPTRTSRTGSWSSNQTNPVTLETRSVQRKSYLMVVET